MLDLVTNVKLVTYFYFIFIEGNKTLKPVSKSYNFTRCNIIMQSLSLSLPLSLWVKAEWEFSLFVTSQFHPYSNNLI